jgi:thiamine-phosphate pyrophosphorylase
MDRETRIDLTLYAVTDRRWTSSLEDDVEKAIRGGATAVQLREKDISYSEFVSLAEGIKRITDRYSIPFIINDNVDVALAVNADGVHIGQSDGNAKDIRKRIGNRILGVSVKTVEQAVKAEADGADHLGCGAIFGTSSKDDADKITTDTLRMICEAVSIPVVAIGGISEDNITQLKGTGIKGVAVISAIFGQDDIEGAAKKLRTLSERVIS